MALTSIYGHIAVEDIRLISLMYCFSLVNSIFRHAKVSYQAQCLMVILWAILFHFTS